MMTNAERDQIIETLLKAAMDMDPENPMDAAREFLAQAEVVKREREMSPYERGHRDAFEIDRAHDNSYPAFSDEHAQYEKGYEDGGEARNEENLRLEDERCDQIERDFIDGECDISGNYYTTSGW